MPKNNGIKTKVDVAVLQNQITQIDGTLRTLNESVVRLETKFDHMESGRLSAVEVKYGMLTAQIEPIRKVVYGLISLVFIAVIGAILKMILIK